MEDQDKQNITSARKANKGINLNLKGVPRSVNKKMKDYQRRISAERGKKFNLKTAYVEFLKEMTSQPVIR